MIFLIIVLNIKVHLFLDVLIAKNLYVINVILVFMMIMGINLNKLKNFQLIKMTFKEYIIISKNKKAF